MTKYKFCWGEGCRTLIPYYPKRQKYCNTCKILENRKKTLQNISSRREAQTLLRSFSNTLPKSL